MGCDIHAYSEKRIGKQWVLADPLSENEYFDPLGDDDPEREFAVSFNDRLYTGRNYYLFGVLAGVRESGLKLFEPRGIPHDCSDYVRRDHESWGVDGHTASYLYLFELEALSGRGSIPVSGMKESSELRALERSIDSGDPEWDLIYPYCKSTNDRSYEDFSFDVPFNFAVGGCLDEIIGKMKARNADRMTFWFDN